MRQEIEQVEGVDVAEFSPDGLLVVLANPAGFQLHQQLVHTDASGLGLQQEQE